MEEKSDVGIGGGARIGLHPAIKIGWQEDGRVAHRREHRVELRFAVVTHSQCVDRCCHRGEAEVRAAGQRL